MKNWPQSNCGGWSLRRTFAASGLCFIWAAVIGTELLQIEPTNHERYFSANYLRDQSNRLYHTSKTIFYQAEGAHQVLKLKATVFEGGQLHFFVAEVIETT